MLDSVGKIPDGLFENTKTVCDASWVCHNWKKKNEHPEFVKIMERLVFKINTIEKSISNFW